MSHSAHDPAHERLRLPRWIRIWVYTLGPACAGTGVLWLVFHHFVHREGPFGPEPHPFEHTWLVSHGIAGLAMLWVLGLVWLPHVRRGWTRPAHRLAGGTMAASMLWLAVSAAGLYYLGNERAREATAIAHWLVGLFATAWLPLHISLGRRAMRRTSTSKAPATRR